MTIGPASTTATDLDADVSPAIAPGIGSHDDQSRTRTLERCRRGRKREKFTLRTRFVVVDRSLFLETVWIIVLDLSNWIRVAMSRHASPQLPLDRSSETSARAGGPILARQARPDGAHVLFEQGFTLLGAPVERLEDVRRAILAGYPCDWRVRRREQSREDRIEVVHQSIFLGLCSNGRRVLQSQTHSLSRDQPEVWTHGREKVGEETFPQFVELARLFPRGGEPGRRQLFLPSL